MTISRLPQENSRFHDQYRALLKPAKDHSVLDSGHDDHASLISLPSYLKKPHIEHHLKRFADSSLSDRAEGTSVNK